MLITTLTPQIVAADPAGHRDALTTSVEAFEDDLACRTFWPGLAAYREHFPCFMRLFAGPAQADRTSNGTGAALLLASGNDVDPEPLLVHLAPPSISM